MAEQEPKPDSGSWWTIAAEEAEPGSPLERYLHWRMQTGKEPSKEDVAAVQSLLKSKSSAGTPMPKTTLAPPGEGKPIAKMPAEGEKIAESSLSQPVLGKPAVDTDVSEKKPTVLAPERTPTVLAPEKTPTVLAPSPAKDTAGPITPMPQWSGPLRPGDIGPSGEQITGTGQEDWSIPTPPEKPPPLPGQKPVSTPTGPNWASGKPVPAFSGLNKTGDITRAPKQAGFGMDPLLQSLTRASLSIAKTHGGLLGRITAGAVEPFLGMMGGGRKKKDGTGGTLAGLLGGSTGGLSELLGGIGGHASGGNQQLMEAIQKLTEAVNDLTEELQKGHKKEAAGAGPQPDGSFIPSLRQAGDVATQKPPQWEGPHYAQGQSGNNMAQQMEILSTLTRLLTAV